MATTEYNSDYSPVERAYYAQSRANLSPSSRDYSHRPHERQDPETAGNSSSNDPPPYTGPEPQAPAPYNGGRRDDGYPSCACCVFIIVGSILGTVAVIGLVVLVLYLMKAGPSSRSSRQKNP